MKQQCFSSLKNHKKLLNFTKLCKHHIKMETQTIVYVLNSSKNKL